MNTRKLVVVAMLSAVATVLMYISFSVPFMPGFIKFDISELPALIAAFSIGPWGGAAVCLVKNLVNLLFTVTGGIGETANFLMGVIFVLPAGYIYKYMKTRKGAIIGSVTGAVVMGVISLPINYFLAYPAYAKLLPIDKIVAMYQAIVPGNYGLLGALAFFNIPYTTLKGIVCAVITFVIYKRISPIIKGK